MELDNLHQVGYAPVDLGVYNKGDTVPHWVAPTDETVTVRTVITGITAPPVTSSRFYLLESQLAAEGGRCARSLVSMAMQPQFWSTGLKPHGRGC